MPSRTTAYNLLCEHTKSESLIKHALAVEAAMRHYAESAKLSDPEVELWGICGLLHDFDYERYPNCAVDGHPFMGEKILAEQGYPADLRRAILGHASYANVPRDTQMAKTLFAVDELCGFITAAALVRPDKSLHTLEPRSVKKRMKDKAFARACSREEIQQGAQELGLDLEVHIGNVIQALRRIAKELGLDGVPAAVTPAA